MRIARELLRYPLPVFAAAVSLVGLGATQLALPWVIKEWLQGPVAEGGVPLAEHVLAALAIVGLLALFIVSSRSLLVSVDQRLVERLRSAAVDHILRLEPATVERYPTGDVMSRVFQDVALLSGVTGTVMQRILGDGLLMIGALFMMFLLQWRLALAACLLAAIVVFALGATGRIIRRLGAVAQERMGTLSTILQEQLQGFTTIKGYQTEAQEAARFSEVNRSYRDTAVYAGAWSATLIGSAFLFAATGFVAAVWLGSQQVAAGRITVGSLLAFCLYAGLTVEPMRRLAETQGFLQRSLPAAERLFELLDLPLQSDATASSMLAPSTPARSVHAPRPRSRGIAVEFENVHFRYLPNRPLLEGVDLRVPPGDRIAVVAASGGGKTTLASLLLRFRDSSAGRILLDGVDLRSYPIPELRRMVCVVEQKPFLFSGPLIENLRYGSWDAREAEVWQAVNTCGLRSLVERHPLGINASLRESGGDLSAGERQRIALARAIVKNPALLVLDEATSAIDSQAEADVFARLEPWLAQRTVILMAHRLSTVRRVSRVVVLAGGRVSGDGTLDELAGGESVFTTLFCDQLEGAPQVFLEPRATGGASP
jgi:subfamily B ATP-binding cassette protein MsbA